MSEAERLMDEAALSMVLAARHLLTAAVALRDTSLQFDLRIRLASAEIDAAQQQALRMLDDLKAASS